MFRIFSFSKIKTSFEEKKIIKTKKDAFLCLIVLSMQILMLIFGVFMHGFGRPILIEQMARQYTTANMSGQTYSLVYHKSDSSLSNLDYHVSTVERDENMKKANCKIFFSNDADAQNDKTPFRFTINSKNIDSSIVFLGNRDYSIKEYFNLEKVVGDLALNDVSDIVISTFFAEMLKTELMVSSIDEIVGITIKNEVDNEDYVIRGIFNESTFLSKFYLGNLIIGHFERFSRISVNPRLGFITGKSYLENLYFMYRLCTFIDPPNYGRTTIVSTVGNDFDKGGNERLTKLIYSSLNIETNSVIKTFTWAFAVGSLALLFYFSYRLFDNKKCIRLIAAISIFNVLIVYFICLLINNNLLNSSVPYLGIVSSVFTFLYFLVLFIFIAVLDSVYGKRALGNSNLVDYYQINI